MSLHILIQTRSGKSMNVNDEYEQLVYDEYSQMKLATSCETKIERVNLTFSPVTDESNISVKFQIEDDGTLVLQLEHTSIEEGIKDALAQMSYEFKAQYVFAPMWRDWALILIPLLSFTFSLYIFDEFARGFGNMFLSMLLGPCLFICIVIPSVFFLLTKKQMKENSLVRHRMKTALGDASLYTKDEVEMYTSRFTKHRSLYHVLEYIMIVPMLVTFILLVIYLH